MSKYDSINEFPEILGVPVRILRNSYKYMLIFIAFIDRIKYK